MPNNNTAVAAAGEETNAVVNQEQINRLRNLSGEANRPNFPKIPFIEIDNCMEEVKLADGGIAEARCQPRFIFTIRNEEAESGYESRPYNEPIIGVVLKIRYYVEKKYEEVSTMPYFRSDEFDSFMQNISIRTKGEETREQMTYADFKERYKEAYTLYSMVYWYMNGKVYKIKMKGKSRSMFWDYMKSFDNNDSITAHYTKVTPLRDDEKQIKYNYMSFEKIEQPINITEVEETATKLNELLVSYDTRDFQKSEEVEVIKTNIGAPGNTPEQDAAELNRAVGANLTQTEEPTMTENHDTGEINLSKIPF